MKAVIVSGGNISDLGFAADRIKNCDLLICADSGIMTALRLGVIADICVGDFDSSAPPKGAAREWVTLPTEKDDTDTMSAARIAVERGADEVVILGGIGSRLDHTLGNLFVLEFLRQKDVCALLADERNEVRLFSKGAHCIPKREGCYLSLLPFCSRPTLSLCGVKYPLTDCTLPDNQPLGVSNRIVAPRAVLEVKEGTVAVFLSHD